MVRVPWRRAKAARPTRPSSSVVERCARMVLSQVRHHQLAQMMALRTLDPGPTAAAALHQRPPLPESG